MFSHLRVLWRLMAGHRLRYLLAFLCLLTSVLLGYAVPLVGVAVIDYAVPGRSLDADTPRHVALIARLFGGGESLVERLWLAPAIMVALSAAAGLFAFLRGWLTALSADGIARGLKDRLYDHLNHLPARFHDNAETGDLVQRCTSDVETTRVFLASQVVEIAQAAVLLGTALPLLYLLSPSLTGVAFALIAPLILYGYFYFRRVKHVFRSVDEAEGELTAVIQENLTGIRVVRAFARQEHAQAQFAGPNQRFRDHNLRLLRLMAWYWSFSDLVALSQLGLILLVGARWVVTGDITVGVLFAFLAYLGILLWPVRQMGRILTDLGKTTVALTRVGTILDEAREADAPEVCADLPARSGGALTAENLRFAHRAGAPATLDGISFTVQPGETLAILGPSGAGKSTLMHLLLRLYDPDSGSLRLDGRDITRLPRAWVRAQFGVVLQEPFLFAKSLRENLRLGRGDAPDSEIEEVARAACIHDTILHFDQGYDTLIGERGITLSGGQRQRVAIARALLKRPPILLLDDALSAVDGETEALILEALRSRHGRATTLVIAHRLATLAHADRVIVLEHGRIVQAGTPAELVVADGLYRRLWQIQTSLETDVAAELRPA